MGRYADAADVGVGTILTEHDARRAIDCGANYLVTPTMNVSVVRVAVERQIAIFPGGLTPTELGAGGMPEPPQSRSFPHRRSARRT